MQIGFCISLKRNLQPLMYEEKAKYKQIARNGDAYEERVS